MLSVIVLFSPSNTIIEVIHDTKNTCIKVNINIVCPNSSIFCLSLKRSKRESERERKTKFLQEVVETTCSNSQGLYARVFGQAKTLEASMAWSWMIVVMLKHLWTCLHLRFSFFFFGFNINTYVYETFGLRK